jgi:ADP-ribosylglycohydrolase
MHERNFEKDALLGLAVGDALGVPVEFVARDILLQDPVTGMCGHGTHNQPPGAWSDDTSLTLCLGEMLADGYNLNSLAGKFVNWKEYGYQTAHGYVFDIGITTAGAIHELVKGTPPELAGYDDERSNGNGSLMRILPLVFFIKDMPVAERFNYTKQVSSVTHRHIRSVIACFIYLEYARQVMHGSSKEQAYKAMQLLVNSFLAGNQICSRDELNKFHRILDIPVDNYDVASLWQLSEEEIYSEGYVINTLEASLWCILHTSSYREAVLKAVNLGKDTDTTAAVTGGIAGLLYGWETIPGEWLEVLAKREDIIELAGRLKKGMDGE